MCSLESSPLAPHTRRGYDLIIDIAGNPCRRAAAPRADHPVLLPCASSLLGWGRRSGCLRTLARPLPHRHSAELGIAPRSTRPQGRNITWGALSMLHCILGFLPFVLDLAGIFLGLALNCLSLVLRLLAQTHDGLLNVLRHQRCRIRTAFQLSCRRRGAPMASGSTPGEAQTFQLSRRNSSRISGIGPAQEGFGPWHGFAALLSVRLVRACLLSGRSARRLR
jgi:hypothetical protein